MALSAFQKDISRIKERQGSVFVYDDANVVWQDIGQVKGVDLSWEPVNTEADTGGRTKMLAADVTITFVMQQTSDQELGALDSLSGNSTTNGHQFKVTESNTAAADAGTAAGYEFNNCLANITGSVSFNGDESTMTVEINGRVPISELVNLGSTQTLTFDA